MSRSRKKIHGFCDRNPFMKNYANRRLRRISVEGTLANGGAYRKNTCPWDICDWRFIHYTEQAFRADVELWWKMYPDDSYKNIEDYLAKEKVRYLKK